jgi:hypothetical protein
MTIDELELQATLHNLLRQRDTLCRQIANSIGELNILENNIDEGMFIVYNKAMYHCICGKAFPSFTTCLSHIDEYWFKNSYVYQHRYQHRYRGEMP